jgi:hypothetical protein
MDTGVGRVSGIADGEAAAVVGMGSKSPNSSAPVGAAFAGLVTGTACNVAAWTSRSAAMV